MDHTTPEVVRVGAPGVRIACITSQRIDYIDMGGHEQSIDLEECAQRWVRWYEEHRQEFLVLPGASQAEVDTENARCVGQRGGGHSTWWAEFMTERKTRFEFAGLEALWRELLGPLMRFGWRTFDTN